MFWSLFEALMHLRDNLDGTVKFRYLFNCLYDEPKELIKSLSITQANFAITVCQLHSRYQNCQKLLQKRLHKFHAIPVLKYNYVDLKLIKAQYTQ